MYADIVVYLRHTIVMNCKAEDDFEDLLPIERIGMKELMTPIKEKWENIPLEEH